MMVHFALADARGNAVAVEYIDNEMVVTDTPVVTNFYLAEGEKHEIGTEQSHTRYEILTEKLKEKQRMDMQGVRDALDSVSKDNFGEFVILPEISLQPSEISDIFSKSDSCLHLTPVHREQSKDCPHLWY